MTEHHIVKIIDKRMIGLETIDIVSITQRHMMHDAVRFVPMHDREVKYRWSMVKLNLEREIAKPGERVFFEEHHLTIYVS